MIWDLIITIGSLALFFWFVIIEPLLKFGRSLRPSPPLPPPRYARRERREPDESGEEALLNELRKRYHEPVLGGTGTYQYVPVLGGTADTTEENQDDPRYSRVLDLVRRGYSGNQVVELVGGSRATILALVKRAKEEMKMR